MTNWINIVIMAICYLCDKWIRTLDNKNMIFVNLILISLYQLADTDTLWCITSTGVNRWKKYYSNLDISISNILLSWKKYFLTCLVFKKCKDLTVLPEVLGAFQGCTILSGYSVVGRPPFVPRKAAQCRMKPKLPRSENTQIFCFSSALCGP